MCFLKKRNIFFINDGKCFTPSNILLHSLCYSNLKTLFSHPKCCIFNTCIHLMVQPMTIYTPLPLKDKTSCSFFICIGMFHNIINFDSSPRRKYVPSLYWWSTWDRQPIHQRKLTSVLA